MGWNILKYLLPTRIDPIIASWKEGRNYTLNVLTVLVTENQMTAQEAIAWVRADGWEPGKPDGA